MTCLGPYCYQILCFSMPDYLNDTIFFYLFLQWPYEMFFTPQKFCVVYIHFYWSSDEGITH